MLDPDRVATNGNNAFSLVDRAGRSTFLMSCFFFNFRVFALRVEIWMVCSGRQARQLNCNSVNISTEGI